MPDLELERMQPVTACRKVVGEMTRVFMVKILQNFKNE